jgi:uncharacterized protein involved in exopolysaccharide biosynthesis
MQQSLDTNDATTLLGPRVFIGRLLETFFRRWWLFLLPVVLFTGLGLTIVRDRGTSYHAAGVIQVNRDSLLNQITSVRNQTTFGFDSPATYTARQVNTLLDTDSFLDSVVKDAGLTDSLTSGALTRHDVRRAVWAAAQGDELVVMNASARDPELSYRLAGATIKSYLQWEIDSSVTQSQSAEQFFESLLVPYQKRLDDARGALASYVSAHPAAGSDADRPADEQVQIASLTEAVSRADDQLSTARSSLSAAQIANAQTSSDVAQRLRVVDNPLKPTAPDPHRKKDAVTLMMFMILGSIVAGAALVMATLLDRSVRYAEEIEAHLEVPVLAMVPNSPLAVQTRIL